MISVQFTRHSGKTASDQSLKSSLWCNRKYSSGRIREGTKLKKHKDEARESMLMYKSMTEKCKEQWSKIKELEAKSCSADEQATLEDLKHGFNLVLSADYQMNKLLPYWGRSPQPGHTYYQQKVSYDVFGIVDHREGAGHVYILSELAGPKNTDHTVSYLLNYLKSTGQVPERIKRVQVFLDNAGSTNKNQYLTGSVYEIVERGIFSFFRVSVVIAGQTKFCPDRLFALLAKSFYSSDVFNEEQFLCVYGQHANVTLDKGGIVQCTPPGSKTSKYCTICDLMLALLIGKPVQYVSCQTLHCSFSLFTFLDRMHTSR